MRIYSGEGALLADVAKEHEVCALREHARRRGAPACGRDRRRGEGGSTRATTATSSTRASPAPPTASSPSSTTGGGSAGSSSGPFLPAAVDDAPPSLLEIDPGIDAEQRADRSCSRCRARRPRRSRASRTHLKAALDLILFSGHKALLTSTMHLASVTRELPRARGEEREAPGGLRPPEGARPPQVELPRHREPRAAHAAHVDHRLQRDARRGDRGRRSQAEQKEFVADDPREGRAAPLAHHEPARSLEARERHDEHEAQADRASRRCSARC